MRRIIIGLLTACAVIAQAHTPKAFTLTGKFLPSLEGQTIYIYHSTARRAPKADSVKVAGGAIRLQAEVPGCPAMWGLSTGDMAVNVTFVADGNDVSVTQTAAGKPLTVAGGQLNAALSKYYADAEPLSSQLASLYARYRDSKTSSADRKVIEAEYDSIDQQLLARDMQAMRQNADNVLGLWFMAKRCYDIKVSELEEVLAKVPSAYHSDANYRQARRIVDNDRKCRVGQPYHDLAMPGPDGKTVRISDYAGRGKYLILDFWASWCGPCRAEMPNMVRIYREFKDKGVEILGISFDRDGDSWRKALSDLGMTWPQMSDLKYWQSEGAAAYGIGSIPAIVIIGPDGRIAAKNLRGDALYEQVKKWAEALK